MSVFLSDFHFIRPLWLLLLLLPLVGWKYFFANIKTSSSWEGVIDKNLLDYLLVKGSSKQRSLISYLSIAGSIAATIALAGPSWQKKEMPVFAPENPVMILLNLSSDMSTKDVAPNRLGRAKFIINDMSALLGNTTTGLIVYSDEPYLISPLTEDNKIIVNLLGMINRDIMPANGDRLNRAIDSAVQKMKDAQYTKGNIVVFSSDVGYDFNQAMQSAASAADDGYAVNVVEINPTPNEKLKMIAQKGKGLYLNAGKSAEAASRIADKINQEQSHDLKLGKNQQEIWLDYGYYLTIVPLLCCLYFFRKGILVIALTVLFANSARAGFFLNNNQEGLRAFNQQDYVTAAEKFGDPIWKGSAYYRMGYFDKAYKYFTENDDPESLYNQGNALAKGGKVEDAIAKYEAVLAQIPEHEDAMFNLEYLKQQQQNQEQNQSEQNEDNKQESGQDQQQNQNQNANGENNQEQEKNGQQPQKSAENQDGDSEQDGKKQQEQAPAPSEQKTEKKATANLGQSEEDAPKYDEKMQARAQQYRDIPEDIGGLLREFIKKEYDKNRYGDK